jgi:ubiquinone/menaquinone biosynthesis C-methylase UbiE
VTGPRDPQLEKIRRSFDRGAGAYDRWMGLTERILRDARHAVGAGVTGRVLDAGIGSGLSLEHYPAGIVVDGVDLSPEMMARARIRADRLGLEVRLHEMDAQHLDFADDTFDSVAFNLCLCTVPDPEAAVREAIRVAKPGVPMLFVEHVRSHLLPVALLQEAITPITVRAAADYFNRRTAETIRRAGVEDLTVKPFAMGFSNLIKGRAPV